MTIAAIKPTIPASPKLCTNPIILLAISPTNGTFPPSKLTAIPKASSYITTFVKLSNIEVNPEIAFMFPPFFYYKKLKRIKFALNCFTLPLGESSNIKKYFERLNMNV